MILYKRYLYTCQTLHTPWLRATGSSHEIHLGTFRNSLTSYCCKLLIKLHPKSLSAVLKSPAVCLALYPGPILTRVKKCLRTVFKWISGGGVDHWINCKHMCMWLEIPSLHRTGSSFHGWLPVMINVCLFLLCVCKSACCMCLCVHAMWLLRESKHFILCWLLIISPLLFPLRAWFPP